MAYKAVVITGIKAIDRKLRRLEPRVQRKVVRQSMRAGLKPMQAEVKSEVPVESGLTRSAVVVRSNRSRRRGVISLAVRISGKKAGLVKTTKAGRRVFYPAVVEYKHDAFMRRSFDSKGKTSRDVAMDRIRRGVDEEVKRS
jgi:Bacteriophage HK97-gp10, putative tail-component